MLGSGIEANDVIGGGTRSADLTLPGFIHDVCSAIHPLAAGSPFFNSVPVERFGLFWIQPEIPLAHPLDNGTAASLFREVDRTADAIRYLEHGHARGKVVITVAQDSKT